MISYKIIGTLLKFINILKVPLEFVFLLSHKIRKIFPLEMT